MAGDQNFAMGIGMPKADPKQPVKVNDDETGVLAEKGVDDTLDRAAKALASIAPFLPLPSALLATGLSKGLERGAITDVMINQAAGSMSAQGGMLYKMFIEPFARNKAIIDHTGGVGGGPEVEAPNIDGMPIDGIPIEPARNDVSFSELIGERMASYSFSDMPTGAPVAPPAGFGGGGHDFGVA